MSKKPKTTTTFSSLTNAALRNLCSLCGLPKTGTKPLIRHRLQLAAHTYQPIPRNARILSIDLGLRNFAFSLISPNPSLPSSPSTSPSLLQACTSLTSLPTSLPNVTLHAWDRLDLIPSVPASFAFSSPASMASLTHSLVTDYLLPLKPTHILIERQRYRSSNQLPIQEWTVRVNTLEAMLHATFRALAPPAEAQVASVTPKLVASYMFPNSSTAETYDYDGVPAVGNRAQRAYRLLKKNKVKMLGRWLAGDQQMIRPGNKDMQKMLGFFVEAFESKGKRRGRKKKKLVGVQAEEQEGEEVMDVREMVGKLDDLSDSVLQGMVWIQWNRNLERLIDEVGREELMQGFDENFVVEVKKTKAARKGRRGRKNKAKEAEELEVGVEDPKGIEEKEDDGLTELKLGEVKKKTSNRGRKRKSVLEGEEEDKAMALNKKTSNRGRKKKTVSPGEEDSLMVGLDLREEDKAMVVKKETSSRGRKRKTVLKEEEDNNGLRQSELGKDGEALNFGEDKVVVVEKKTSNRGRKKKTVVSGEKADEVVSAEKDAAAKAPLKRSRKKKDFIID